MDYNDTNEINGKKSNLNDSIMSLKDIRVLLSQICDLKLAYEIDSISNSSTSKESKLNYFNKVNELYKKKRIYIISFDYYLKENKYDTTLMKMFEYCPAHISHSSPCQYLTEKELVKLLKYNLEDYNQSYLYCNK